jgi:hypothetical protein
MYSMLIRNRKLEVLAANIRPKRDVEHRHSCDKLGILGHRPVAKFLELLTFLRA